MKCENQMEHYLYWLKTKTQFFWQSHILKSSCNWTSLLMWLEAILDQEADYFLCLLLIFLSGYWFSWPFNLSWLQSMVGRRTSYQDSVNSSSPQILDWMLFLQYKCNMSISHDDMQYSFSSEYRQVLFLWIVFWNVRIIKVVERMGFSNLETLHLQASCQISMGPQDEHFLPY